jgi:hypothetical protein
VRQHLARFKEIITEEYLVLNASNSGSLSSSKEQIPADNSNLLSAIIEEEQDEVSNRGAYASESS